MNKPDRRNWKQKFFKTVPMVELDIDGNPDFNKPIPQDPSLNKDGFWGKPETTSSNLNDHITKLKNEQINKYKKNK